ncbi:hypothetical protein QG37_01090 [Candidozyma auris]|uniref:Uncharacterized protein n=1 Tax=Candidozyma auris TaxID=498019 RepID=A0A0L0P634_CANAR|nr:hypothetical protein QG37_01090 [[Candida] auris]
MAAEFEANDLERIKKVGFQNGGGGRTSVDRVV